MSFGINNIFVLKEFIFTILGIFVKKIKVDEIFQKLHRYDGGDIDEKEMRISTKRVQINDDMDFWI